MNKRRVLCGMLAAVCCLALAACGGEKAVEVDAAALAQKLVGGLQFRDEMAQIDGAIAQQRYGVDETIEVTMYRGSGATAEEVTVLKAADEEGAQQALAAANKHIEDQIAMFENYIPAEVKILNTAIVQQRGNAVVLVVADDPAAAQEILDEYFKS